MVIQSPLQFTPKHKMNDFALTSTIIKTTVLISVPSSSWKPQRRVFTISCGASRINNKPCTSNFYGVLSISSPENTEAEEIKRAYRAMALRYHPDTCRDPSLKEESARMFLLVHEAYRTLSDPVLRREYDFELGLSTLGRKSNNSIGSRSGSNFYRGLWQYQLYELRKMNCGGIGKKEGSWGSRMREQNRRKY